MTSGEEYRAKALQLLSRAEVESSPVLKAELGNLASAYLRLAERANRNTALIVEFELPSEEDSKS